MESLDAGHALLSDVATRNRELQARLRSSLPLLWTSSALVTTSAAGPRRRRGGGGLPAEQSAAGEADQMLLALEGQSGLQVSRRYKRRMEWEVARRIARVDRELQQYPPAQRFWNHKRKEPTPSHASAAYRQRASGVRRADVQRKSDGVGGQRKPAVKAAAGRAKSGVPHTSAVNQQEKKGWTKPKVATEMDGGVGRMIKHLSASPVRGGVEDTEDKENTKPNAATRAQAGAQFAVGNSKESPLWGDLTAVKKVLGKPHDGLSVSEDEIKESKPGDSAHDLEATSNTVLRQPAEAKSESLRPAPSPLTDDIFTNEKDTVANARQDGVGDDTFVIAESSPRRTKTPAEERASSSIGRQVLSDYRTMPSVASFGAQPILSGAMGNPADMRWNADVLRRLFSDLDTDKDGHVNRIETCMALHRLRISVPTTKIISFFRHIHSSDAKGARSRHTQHLPMKEVINYKEFVAFVTAAYDQQQQRRAQRSRAPTRRKVRKEEHDTVAHLSAPSTSLPIYAHPTRSPRASRYVHPREDDARVYEVNLEQGEAAIEDRVMKEIPDFLVSRILAGTASAASVESRENVVRKSLELLVGKEAVDDKIVSEITQELIREQLRNIGSLNQDDTEDVTGLKRAAAYYNEQMTQCDSESCSVAEDSSSEDLINWADVLTEEQVSGLVQQIWKDRQAAGLRRMSVVPVEDVLVEERTEMPEDPTVRWTNEATDMKELSVPAILTDKAVQAFDGDYQAEPSSTSADLIVAAPEVNHEGVVVSSPAVAALPLSMCLPQTHLGRAVANALSGAEQGDDGFHKLFHPVTSIDILQRLRQQRRTHQSTLNRQQTHSCLDEPAKANSGVSVSDRGEDANDTYIDLGDGESVFSSEEACESFSSRRVEQDHQLHHKHENRDSVALPTAEHLTQKNLHLDESASEKSILDVARSISVSSSGLSSSQDYHHMYGIYREIDRHQTRASSQRHSPSRRIRRLSVSGSSVPDSICSAELSEGELSREEALDLSDGEIFGDCKRKYVKHKSKALNVVESVNDDDNRHSSVESGELPALMKAHANFRSQLVDQSTTSSVESGELEDGSVPD